MVKVEILLSAGMCLIGPVVLAKGVSVDFSENTVPVRRALHSSGYAPKITSGTGLSEQIKQLNFEYLRTHDLALIDSGQRIVDTHFIFPLMHLDAGNPSNYYFAATDYLLKLARGIGYKIFYRLGTSIEHSGPKVHFNTLIPEDFDKMAEVFAGIIRHYNKGWGNGFNWGIDYWEIWNEPDGMNNMWCLPDGDGGAGKTPKEIRADAARRTAKRRELFAEFFVKCIKRIKSEFPDVKVGGPALCNYKADYFRYLLTACKKAGVAPDFISWHYYGRDPDTVMKWADNARALCDEMGFKDCELIINEWHYLGSYSWGGLRSRNPAMRKKVWQGPASHNGIDSSCFTLSTLARFQTSRYSQAYFYGCRHTGAWGYMDGNFDKYKVWYALEWFGSIMDRCTMLCKSSSSGTVTTLGAKSADGKKGWLLVSDYCGKAEVLNVNVQGVEKIDSAKVLDFKRNSEPVDVKFENGVLELKKKTPGSAAFLVEFTL